MLFTKRPNYTPTRIFRSPSEMRAKGSYFRGSRWITPKGLLGARRADMKYPGQIRA